MISLPWHAKNSDSRQPDQLWLWVVQDHILSVSGGFCGTGKVTDKSKGLLIIEFRMYFSRSFLCLHNVLFPYLYHVIISYSLSQWAHKSPIEAKTDKVKLELKHSLVNSIRISKTAKEGAGISISNPAHRSYLPSGNNSLSGIQRLFCILIGLEA